HPKTLTPGARAEIEVELDKEKLAAEQRANVEKALKILPPETTGKIERAIKPKKTPTETPKTENATDKELEAKEPDRPVVEFGKDSASPANGFEKWIEGHAKQKLGEHGTNLQLFLITMISNLPYMVLCCIPLFAFVLKILYLRKRVFYIDHLVYALHIHTFAYLAIMLITSTIAASAREHRIAFERSDAAYTAKLDGTAEKKIADGIFPAISPDGILVAFNTVEKTSDTTYMRHIAVTDVATGKTTVFK